MRQYALVFAVSSACGTGSRPQGEPDGSVDVGGDTAAPQADASAAETPDAGDAPEAQPIPNDAAGPDTAAVAPDAPAELETGSETQPDLERERPVASASWTLAPNPICVATGTGCMDTGAVGGYQITASGSCPTASDVQLWFPGGVAPLAAGSYTVKPAAGILDVISMPAGMVGVLAERAAPPAHSAFWGRAGTVTVAAMGEARAVSFSGVSMREATTGVMTTLDGDVACP
jgi:hypothetical protein